jgi:putative FmdB family regulatory protein
MKRCGFAIIGLATREFRLPAVRLRRIVLCQASRRRECPLPIYTYACNACGAEVERRQSFTEAPLTICESCGGALRRLLHPVGVIFKGSGFYNTDYKKVSGNGSNGSSDGTADKGKDGATGETKSTESKKTESGESETAAASSTKSESSSKTPATSARE